VIDSSGFFLLRTTIRAKKTELVDPVPRFSSF
jgi:hypothetical protein